MIVKGATGEQNPGGIGCKITGDVEQHYGFRCRTANDIFTNLTDIARHLCTNRCMMLPGCVVINYNMDTRYCLLSKDICEEYNADEKFVVTYFGSKEALCVRWIPYTSYANATTVAVANCHSQSRYETCTVGRLVSSLNTVPGKYYDDIQTAWYVLDGVESTNGQIEILDIQDGCQITWIPYNTCDTIPTGAVLGEYLAWKGGIDLYITRGNVYRLNIIGYYNPVDAIGHICLWGKIL